MRQIDESEDGLPQPLSIRKNMLWNSAGSLLFWGCQWLMTVFVVRLSDSYDAAGTLALAMAIYNTFSPLSVYRMFTYQISDVAHENTQGEYFAFKLITSGATLIIWIAYTATTCPASSFAAVMIYIVSRLCRSLIDVLHATEQLNNRMDYIGISNGFQGVASIVLFCIVFSLSKSLEVTFLAITVATIIIGVVYDLPRALRFEPLEIRISGTKVRYLLLTCLPVVLATVAMHAVPSIPRQYLAFIAGEGALGVYASIAAPAAIIQMGSTYIYNAVLSTLSRSYLDRDKKAFMSLFAKTFAGIIVVGFILGTALIIAGPWLFELMFGPSIKEHLYLLIPVLILTIITGLLWFANDVLISIRRFKGMIVGNLFALVVALSATPFLVGSYGANGISFASIAGYGTGLLVMIWFYIQSISSLDKNDSENS